MIKEAHATFGIRNDIEKRGKRALRRQGKKGLFIKAAPNAAGIVPSVAGATQPDTVLSAQTAAPVASQAEKEVAGTLQPASIDPQTARPSEKGPQTGSPVKRGNGVMMISRSLMSNFDPAAELSTFDLLAAVRRGRKDPNIPVFDAKRAAELAPDFAFLSIDRLPAGMVGPRK